MAYDIDREKIMKEEIELLKSKLSDVLDRADGLRHDLHRMYDREEVLIGYLQKIIGLAKEIEIYLLTDEELKEEYFTDKDYEEAYEKYLEDESKKYSDD